MDKKWVLKYFADKVVSYRRIGLAIRIFFYGLFSRLVATARAVGHYFYSHASLIQMRHSLALTFPKGDLVVATHNRKFAFTNRLQYMDNK